MDMDNRVGNNCGSRGGRGREEQWEKIGTTVTEQQREKKRKKKRRKNRKKGLSI